jgi:hypothetical protein
MAAAGDSDMDKITRLLLWAASFCVAITVAGGLLSQANTISNIAGVLLTIFWLWFSIKTRCFTQFSNLLKRKNNK